MWINTSRKAFFSVVFGVFVLYTIKYHDYIPSPKKLNEKHRKQWNEVKLPIDKLKTGDLVLRHGKGFVSDAILSFSTDDPQYSHSGVLEIENGRAYVYHAIGGEENETNKTRKEPLEIFCHPSSVYKFGIFRYDLDDETLNTFVGQMRRYYEEEMEFDLDFDMTTEDEMYCSEMIFKAMTLATNGKNFIPLSHVLEKPYVAIDDLYLNDFCNQIFSYDYD